jgi:hypothetical protein
MARICLHIKVSLDGDWKSLCDRLEVDFAVNLMNRVPAAATSLSHIPIGHTAVSRLPQETPLYADVTHENAIFRLSAISTKRFN